MLKHIYYVPCGYFIMRDLAQILSPAYYLLLALI